MKPQQIDATELERKNGHVIRDMANRSAMERAMLHHWSEAYGETWQKGQCKVCAKEIPDFADEPVEITPGQKLEFFPTVCDECMPMVHAHQNGGEVEKDNGLISEWLENCPKLYQDILSGHIKPDKINHQLIERVESWQVGPTGLIVLGESGQGKTTAMWSLARELAEQGVTYAYWSAIELGKELSRCAKDLRSSYHLTRKRVLLIDDLGKERITNAAASLWWELFNRRYEQRLPVIITTRFSGEAFERRMGATDKIEMGEAVIAKDIRRRLRDMCLVIQG